MILKLQPSDVFISEPSAGSKFRAALVVAVGVVFLCTPAAFAAERPVAGMYQCAAFHAGKIFLPCGSMRLYLDSRGSYWLAGESGTYRVVGNSVVLSVPKTSRRPRAGHLLGKDEIVFQYSYRGSLHTVLFKREKLPRGWKAA